MMNNWDVGSSPPAALVKLLPNKEGDASSVAAAGVRPALALELVLLVLVDVAEPLELGRVTVRVHDVVREEASVRDGVLVPDTDLAGLRI